VVGSCACRLRHAELVAGGGLQGINAFGAAADLSSQCERRQAAGIFPGIRTKGIEQIVGIDMFTGMNDFRAADARRLSSPIGGVAVNGFAGGRDR
jgi:hypothetical protein